MSAGGCVLGFDVGARRIGVAIGSALSGAARDLDVVPVHPAGPDWPRIESLLRQWQPQRLLVGDPAALDGGDQPARQRARAFARELRRRFGLAVDLVDERCSSQEAARRFALERAGGARRRREAERLDALAAAVIVQRWLDQPTPPSPSDDPP